MTDSQPAAGELSSNAPLLLIIGAVGLLVALLAFPSAFLVLAGIVAVGGLAAAALKKDKPADAAAATVQLQELPRKSSSRELPQQVPSGQSRTAAVDAPAGVARGNAQSASGNGEILRQAAPATGSLDSSAALTELAARRDGSAAAEPSQAANPASPTAAAASVPPAAAAGAQGSAPSSEPALPPPPQTPPPQQQQQVAAPAPAADQPVMASTFTSSGKSTHTSTSSHTVAKNGEAPRMQTAMTQSGSSWSAAGGVPTLAPPPAPQQQQQALPQAAQSAKSPAAAGRPAAGGAAILARLK